MATERVMDAIERSNVLDRIGRTLTNVFGRVVRPGRVKDLASGTWLGHPLHPLLTDVTIAAWGSASLLDLYRGKNAQEAARRLVMAGLATAIPTALTGLSELADIVEARARRVAALHALGNITALGMYAASYATRQQGVHGAGQLLSMAGAASLAASGYLGGHLAYRQGVGVNQTAFLDGPTEWTAVANDADVPDGTLRRVRADGVDVVLLRRNGRLYAVANRCSHRGGPLHLGRTEGTTVRCPWHHSVFDLIDGSVVRGPASAPQPRYEIRVRDQKIELRVGSP